MSEEPIHKFNLRLPASMKEELEEEAKIVGSSLNGYIVGVLAHRSGALALSCDHEPYISIGLFATCYRCGTPLTVHRT